MTELLQKAFREASKLPDDEQQQFAAWILQELAAERRWDEAFGRSADLLARLADEALAERQAGKTRVLDPETM